MIVACTSCFVQYTVPDAKVRGRKVRATCKRCRASFVIDGTQKPPEPARLPDLPFLMGDVVATRVTTRPAFSVHDEQTVVGQIPAAALEAERRYAQRTEPPPANGPALDATSEPATSAIVERALPLYTSETPLFVPEPLAAQSSPAPAPNAAITSPPAGALEPRRAPSRKRTTYLLVAVAAVLVTAVVVALTTR